MEEFLPIREIKPGMKSWAAKVTVQEKRQPASSDRSPTTYQKLILVDANGSQVEGILFNRAIQVMGTRLSVFKKYKIANAEVRQIDEQYRSDGLTIQWIISTKTVIEELPEDADMIPTKFCYTMFKDLAQFMELNNHPVDILAVVINILPITAFTNAFGPGRVQKFVIINEEKIPLQLSMFNEFIDNEGQEIAKSMNNFPVIICRRLKVKSFNGVTLSTRKDSSILVNPPIHEAEQLKIWATNNAVLFSQIIKEQTYARYNPDLFLQSPQKFTLIFYLQPTQKFAWIKASISFQHIFQRYWYMACKKCYKATDASYGYVYTCNKCSENQAAAPRCRFDVKLSDPTGHVTATVFGELAEKLLTHSAADAMDHFNQNLQLPLERVHEDLKNRIFAVQIQPAQSRYNDPEQRYTVIYFYELVGGESSSSLPIPTQTSFLLDSPMQSSPSQTQENKSPPRSVCINLSSKFDEAADAREMNLQAGSETPNLSAAKKTKLA